MLSILPSIYPSRATLWCIVNHRCGRNSKRRSCSECSRNSCCPQLVSLVLLFFSPEIFIKDEKNVNDTALQLLLNFVNERTRFQFYLDKLIRSKIIKGAPFFMNATERLCKVPEKVSLDKLVQGVLLIRKLDVQQAEIHMRSSFEKSGSSGKAHT